MTPRDQNCSFCRMMRGVAFSGLGMGLGATAAYLAGASKENMVYTGIVFATILVFGLLGRNQND